MRFPIFLSSVILLQATLVISVVTLNNLTLNQVHLKKEIFINLMRNGEFWIVVVGGGRGRGRGGVVVETDTLECHTNIYLSIYQSI